MPAPPYSGFTRTPMRPMDAAFFRISEGNSWASSRAAATGSISLRAKSRTMSRRIRCSSLRRKSMQSFRRKVYRRPF